MAGSTNTPVDIEEAIVEQKVRKFLDAYSNLCKEHGYALQPRVKMNDQVGVIHAVNEIVPYSPPVEAEK